jgi:hypothetical protein
MDGWRASLIVRLINGRIAERTSGCIDQRMTGNKDFHVHTMKVYGEYIYRSTHSYPWQ